MVSGQIQEKFHQSYATQTRALVHSSLHWPAINQINEIWTRDICHLRRSWYRLAMMAHKEWLPILWGSPFTTPNPCTSQFHHSYTEASISYSRRSDRCYFFISNSHRWSIRHFLTTNALATLCLASIKKLIYLILSFASSWYLRHRTWHHS